MPRLNLVFLRKNPQKLGSEEIYQSEAAAAHRLLEENTLQKAGTLLGKIIVVP